MPMLKLIKVIVKNEFSHAVEIMIEVSLSTVFFQFSELSFWKHSK